MKPVKHLSAYGKKLTYVPELSYKKGLFNSPLSPKPKEKHSVKVVRDKLEPMVLRSPPTGESVVRFALPIPSSKTKELIAEDELLRKITKHLKMVVSSLEETYGISTENVEKPVVKPEQEEIPLSVGNDLNSFLVCCSQFAAQLEEAVQEERHILESLFKWFQQQVNQVEEISKDQNYSEVEFPAPDKTVTSNIAQVGKHAEEFEELKNRLREGSGFSWKMLMSNSRDSRSLAEAMQGCENIQQKIEEFIDTHSTEEFIGVFAPEPQTAYSVSNQVTAMLKIFEKQSDMLKRARSDQVLLETKYKQMQSDFQVLSEEKSMLENELQKLKNTEKTKPARDQRKKTMKTEKKYTKVKSETSEEKKSVVKELKIKEDFHKTQKIEPTYDRAKKIMKTEKYTKEKAENSEEKKSLVKELKIKEDFLKIQEADETSKPQQMYFLNQGELLKSGEMIHTTMERSISKTKVKSEDLKYIPLEKERSKAQVLDSSGQDTNGKIQEHPQISVVYNGSSIENRSEKKRASPAISDLSQILKSQDESAFIGSSKEVSADEDQPPMPPSKSADKSFTSVLSSRESQDLLSVGTLLPGNEPVTTSFVSHPVVTERKSMDSDISKADTLEEILQSKTEKQTYQEEREVQVHDKVPHENHENLTLENKMLSIPPIQILEQNSFRIKRRNAIFIAQENVMISEENQLPEDMDSFLRSQSQSKNLEATRNKTFSTYDGVPDENRMLMHEDSMSEKEMQVEKQMTYQGEGLTHIEVPDENPVLEHQDSTSKIQLQVQRKRSSKEERLNTHDNVPDENLMLDHQEPLSKPQIQVKKQGSSTEERFTTQDEVPYESHMLEQQGSLSKSEIQMNQRTYKEEELNAPDEIPDKRLTLKHQDSVSKTQVQLKEQKSSEGVRHNSHFGVPDKNLVLVNQDSVSKPQMQVEKQVTYGGERCHNQDMNKHSDGSFTLEDLELATQRLTVENEADSELPHTAENLAAMNPSINDLILQLDLNKVVEIDIEHLKGAIQRPTLMAEMKIQSNSLLEADTEQELDITERGAINGEIKTQSKSHPGTNVESLSDATGSGMTRGEVKRQSINLPEAVIEPQLDLTERGAIKGGMKTQSKSHPGTNVERLSDATGSGMRRGQVKKQSMDLPGTNVERLSDITGSGMTRGQVKKQSMKLPETDPKQLLNSVGRGFIKWGISTQSKSHPETDIEHFTDTVGRENTISEIKTQLKSYPDVNLFKDKDMPTQHQEFFTRPVEPSKVSPSVSNFSPFDNQGMTLFEKENRSSPQNSFPKRVTPRTFPTKVINLSPFGSQGGTDKNFSSYVTKPPTALHRTFRSSSYKNTHLPSLKKETSGHPKKSHKKSVGFTIALPNVISKARKTTHKVPHTTARKSPHHHTHENK